MFWSAGHEQVKYIQAMSCFFLFHLFVGGAARNLPGCCTGFDVNKVGDARVGLVGGPRS